IRDEFPLTISRVQLRQESQARVGGMRRRPRARYYHRREPLSAALQARERTCLQIRGKICPAAHHNGAAQHVRPAILQAPCTGLARQRVSKNHIEYAPFYAGANRPAEKRARKSLQTYGRPPAH